MRTPPDDRAYGNPGEGEDTGGSDGSGEPDTDPAPKGARPPSLGSGPRPSDTDILDHPKRVAIVEFLQREPGATFNLICRRLDFSVGVVEHHLSRLLDSGLLVRFDHVRGNDVAHFLAEDAELWENPRTRILYGRSAVREVALYVAAHPGSTSQEIADGTGRSRSITHTHLHTLKDLRLIDVVHEGRQRYYHPSSELVRWTETVGPRFQNGNDT